MSALEYQFPDAKDAPADYLEVAVNSFNNIVGRWDMTSCGGGLKWQIYPENAYGFNYKNSISNGAAFALGARLARYTGNQTYADWAVKIFDWTKKVGLISDQYEVFDGSDDKSNCATVADKTQWTYNNAMFLHGSAFMYDYMKGDSTWKERTSGFLEHAEQLFFKPYDNATDIMYEWACETGESGRHCNLDQQSFKAYLSRFMAKTAIMAPFTKDTITKYLKASAVGAAKSCSGGTDGTTCGSKWYTGAWDGTSGVGQQLSALEVTQSLLMIMKNIMPAKMDSESKPEPTAIVNPKPSSTPAATVVPTPSSQAPAPAPLSTAPSSPSSSTVDAPAPPKSSAPAPAPSVSAPASSVAPVPVKPSADASVSMAPSAQYSTSVKPGGQFGQKSSSTSCAKADGSCTCTPSMTTTVYVPAATSSCSTSVTTTVYVQPPVASDIGSTLIPGPPANSSVPGPSASPSQPLEFQGAAVSVRVTGASIIGGAVLGMLAGLI
jgi:mannan endo-1,6-alpha-mannosidase